MKNPDSKKEDIIKLFKDVDNSKEFEDSKKHWKVPRGYKPTSELLEDKLYAWWWFGGFSLFGIIGLAMLFS